MGLFDNLFGKRHNVERGRDVENEFRSNSEIQGYDVERTGIGSDHKRTRRDLLTGKKGRPEYWEEKRNDSPLSERQKKTPGLKVYRRYDPSPKRPLGETRVEDRFRNKLERDMFTGRYRRVPKQERNPFDFSFGSSSGYGKKRRKNDDFSFF